MTAPRSTRTDAAPSTTADRLSSDPLRAKIERRLNVPPWVLLVQVFVGLGWLRAAVEKVIDPSWWDGEVISGFLGAHVDLTLPWYRGFVETVVEPHVLVVAVTVVLAQAFAGVALLSGRNVRAALATGMFLNLNFMAAGAVNPSIFYLIFQAALLLWILHGESSPRKRPLRLLATASLALVLLNLPFVSTIDPEGVIEDPAMTLVTIGLLTAIASRTGLRYAEERRGQG